MLLCLLVGWWVGREGRLPDGFAGALNAFCVQVSLPALVLQHLHKIEFSTGVLMLAATPWIVFAVATVLAHVAGRVWQLPKQTVGCLALVCGTGNTSIVGIPLITTLAGASAVGAALVVDQSNFVVMCTAGLVTANLCAGGSNSWRAIAWRIVTYRPVQMMALALALRPFQFPEGFEQALSALGGTLTPLALVAVAVNFRKSGRVAVTRTLALGLGIKLLVAPAVVFACWLAVAWPAGEAPVVSVLQAAMPPMIIAGLIAEEKDLDPALARLLVTVGIPLSFLTAAFWRVCLP